MPDSLKENKKPSRKEGSKTMAELQCDFIVLRKKYKAQVGTNQKLEKQCKLLQEIGGKQLLELNTLKQDAFREYCQSLTIYKLEMQLKSLKANQEAHAQQRTRTMQSSSTAAENTTAQMAALIRKAAAAQEAADSSQQQLEQSTQEHAQRIADAHAAVESTQQQLTHSTQVHSQQMAATQAAVDSMQQELQHASQSLAQMQSELAAARQMHADHVAKLQQDNVVQMASVTADFTTRLAVADAELCDLKASLASTKDQHAQSLAELQQLSCSLRDQLSAADSIHAMMVVVLQAKLATANRLKRAIEKRGCKKCSPQRSSQHPIKLPQAEPQHFAGLVQAYTYLLASIAKHPADFADYPDLVALSSSQAELIPISPHSTLPATPDADSDAPAATAAEAECRVLRQQLTALRERLALAQVEILAHANISVNCRMSSCLESAAGQDAEHCWTPSEALQQLQQQVHGVAVAVRKQHEADCIAAAPDHSRGLPQHAVTLDSVSKVDNDYPSHEADLYDWTSEQGDSDIICELQTGSTQTAASHSDSTCLSLTSSAGENGFSSGSSGRSDLQKLTGTDADTTDPQDSLFFLPGVGEEQFRTSAAQMRIRSFSAADVALCDTTTSAVGSCQPPVDPSGANTGSIHSSTDAGSTTGSTTGSTSGSTSEGSSCVAMATGSFGEYYESEENDLDDWTRDEVEVEVVDKKYYPSDEDDLENCTRDEVEVVDRKYYPSDDDDLDDWTCAEEEDDSQSE
ncbi:hypothetical protein ABBQ38_013557 [Trebouxia sp. C0009 RCD-2024]